VNKKGLSLLSGGLDSVLASRLILDQGIELEAISFITYFHTSGREGRGSEARKASRDLGIELKTVDMTDKHIEMIKNPKYGYGKNVNPCIDCRIFMFEKAGEYMEDIGASFIVTGEVVGERPMSQRMDAIRLIEKKAGLKGRVVRPLSAKLLKPSIAEEEGIVDRTGLLDISGRSRKAQIALAERLGIKDYPSPAGGCMLTDPGFSKRVKDLLAHNAFTPENAKLLNLGRHFRLSPTAKLIVGRDKNENKRLLGSSITGDILFDVKGTPSPKALLRADKVDADIINTSCGIISRYADGERRDKTVVYWEHAHKAGGETTTTPATEDMLNSLRI